VTCILRGLKMAAGMGNFRLAPHPTAIREFGVLHDSMSALAICRQLRGPDHTFQIADHLSGTTVKKHMFRFSR
jgi:hypothetical protein